MTTASYAAFRARKYAPELDGLRAISVALVVSFHMHDHAAWRWLNGRLGVVVFFVLSGYLITTLALREESETGKCSLVPFYIRRTFRIFPLYYLTLITYCVLVFGLHLHPEKGATFAKALPFDVAYLQEIPYFYGLDGQPRRDSLAFFHSWSLGIEEKFYLVWPALAFLMWRGSRHRVALTAGIVASCAIVLTPLCDGHGSSLAARVSACLFPYQDILIGCLAALVMHDEKRFEWLGKVLSAGASRAIVAALVALQLLSPVAEDHGVGHLAEVLYGVAVGLLIMAMSLRPGRISRVLSWRPLVEIGKLSYGIYLVHVLCIFVAERFVGAQRGLLGSVAAYVLACGLALVGARLLAAAVERPAIRLGRRLSERLKVRTRALVSRDQAPGDGGMAGLRGEHACAQSHDLAV